MAHEIERKFLIIQPLTEILQSHIPVQSYRVEQRYLPDSGSWTIRIRRNQLRQGVEHWLTFKKRITDLTCVEIEESISAHLYQEIAEQCGPVLEKTRYVIEYCTGIWEVDHFTQPIFDNLVVAEIEVESEQSIIIAPPWLGQEVTHDRNFKNAKMAKLLGDAL